MKSNLISAGTFHLVRPDSVGYCVYYIKAGSRGFRQKFFGAGKFEDAFSFANDLTADDRCSHIHIVETCHYYFDGPRSIMEFPEDSFVKEVD